MFDDLSHTFYTEITLDIVFTAYDGIYVQNHLRDTLSIYLSIDFHGLCFHYHGGDQVNTDMQPINLKETGSISPTLETGKWKYVQFSGVACCTVTLTNILSNCLFDRLDITNLYTG